jgi:hypothetical protein
LRTLVAVLSLALCAPLAASAETWTGWITDSHCGGGKAKPGVTAAQVEMCVKGGATWQVWDEKAGKGLDVDDPAKVRPFTGKRVKVTGTLDSATGKLKVENVEWLKD